MNELGNREAEIARLMATCKHYRGCDSVCAAGINLRQMVGGENLGWVCRLPCHPGMSHYKGVRVECDKREPHTREEAETAEDHSGLQLERFRVAHRVAKEDAKRLKLGKGNGGRGSVTCPTCNGTLSYSVASLNGHMHAKCSTNGCVSWME